MRTAKTKTAVIAALLGIVSLLAALPASASAGPRWEVDSLSNTTAQPGDILDYDVQIFNTGDQAMDGSAITLTVQLPEGLSVADPTGPVSVFGSPHYGFGRNFKLFSPYETYNEYECTEADGVSPLVGGESEVRCQDSEPTEPYIHQFLELPVTVDAGKAIPGQALLTRAEVSGGGGGTATTVDPVRVSATPPGFGFDAFDATIGDAAGKPFTRAGAHPYQVSVPLDLNSVMNPRGPFGPLYPAAPVRDIVAELPAGFIGNPNAFKRCNAEQLSGTGFFVLSQPTCPITSQLGVVTVRNNGQGGGPFSVFGPVPMFNMEPPPGVAARFGFNFFNTVVVLDARLRPGGDYGITVASDKISEGLAVTGVTTTFWGQPGLAVHDGERGCPGAQPIAVGRPAGGETCAGENNPTPFLRMPTSCQGPLAWNVHADSWEEPAAVDSFGQPDLGDPNWQSTSALSHEPLGYPHAPEEWGAPIGVGACDVVPVKAKLDALPTSIDTESPSGLAVHVEVPNPGLSAPNGISSSDIKAVKVALPEGVTINPSQAEGLGVCSPAQYESSRLSFHPDPGHGCPSDSKIGTVEVHTPLLEETVPGNVYIAKPYENPFKSLLALYIVLEEPQRGILVKLAGEVRTNERTGRIETEFKDLPQVPFASFDFHFREGARAPLVTPPTCGRYTTESVFTPWSNPGHPIDSDSSFEIVHGIGGGPCPSGGIPPFHPGFSAGAINNNAGSYSPFTMRLTRNDGEQDMTKFSAVLPRGVSAKIAGLSKCPDAAIEAAKSKTGLAEKATPSCPASSAIGRTLVGAGVGSVLAYVPGQLYLAGPYHGAPLSVASITPAVAGPFDIGTVVVRVALTLDPRTAEVHVDGAASDPIPHILKGIPVKVRDIRVYADRPDFTINPTSCDPSAVAATLFGSYADVFNPADDVPVALSSRFQAAGCASLGFKPRLALKLKGGTRRGSFPALRGTYAPRPGDANTDDVSVTLPHSAFLEQAHIRTICTRVQFAARACPPGSVYGHVKAWTPLLDEPLEGPVYLRSSNHKLPDMVLALHGVVEIESVGRIDSIGGGIRASFEGIPDAPISKVVLSMQGAKKGLIVNSTDICNGKHHADARLSAHNGKPDDFKPLVKADCGKGRGRQKGGRRR